MIKPGDIVLFRGRRRLVLAVGRTRRTRLPLSVFALEKIRGSWTEPNPTAWYDGHLLAEVRVVKRATPATRRRAAALMSYRTSSKCIGSG